MNRMNVTVFGAARPQPGDSVYSEGVRLGRLLAARGHTVVTGGYMGLMEAVSRGAAEGGAHVIGITCAEIENWRKTSANPWVKEEWKARTLVERLNLLIYSAGALIALPGGAGTLTEVSLAWNLILVSAVTPRPLILVGPGWKNTFTSLMNNQGEYIVEADRSWLSYATGVEEAVGLLPA